MLPTMFSSLQNVDSHHKLIKFKSLPHWCPQIQKKKKNSRKLNFRNLKKRGQEAGYVEATFVTRVQEKAMKKFRDLFLRRKPIFDPLWKKKIQRFVKDFYCPYFK